MDKLSCKQLKTLARENEITRWSKMTKSQLTEALEGQNITFKDLTVPELRSAAKSREDHGFS